MPKPIVLIIIHYYLPGYRTGGPVRTTSNMVEQLGDEIDFRILTADHDKGTTTPYASIAPQIWHQVGKAQVRYLSRKELRLWEFARIVAETKCDLVYIDSILGTTSIQFMLLRKLGLIPRNPIIVAPRGHLHGGALSLKASKKRYFLNVARSLGFYREVIWHASSDNEKADILREIGRWTESRIHVIPNLTAPALKSVMTAQHSQDKPSGQLRLVYLSRISKVKNLDYVLQVLAGIEGEITFDIYGYIEDQTYWQSCLALCKQMPPNITVTYKGVVPYEEVISILSNYHLFVLPTLGENFGHTILEALCAGCPVLISDRTPWRDLDMYEAGWVIPLENMELYRTVIQEIVYLDNSSYIKRVEKAVTYGFRYQDKINSVAKTRGLLTSSF
jgi:glycosyltransferase involved in cell wall biosynthesis